MSSWHSPRDIGKLIKEIPADVFAECEDEMKDALWKWARPHIQRGLTSGFPEFYKERVLTEAFEKGGEKCAAIDSSSTTTDTAS